MQQRPVGSKEFTVRRLGPGGSSETPMLDILPGEGEDELRKPWTFQEQTLADASIAEQLADRVAVQDVIIRYAACIDDRDFDSYRSCFAPDVVLHGFGREAIHGVYSIGGWRSVGGTQIDIFRAPGDIGRTLGH